MKTRIRLALAGALLVVTAVATAPAATMAAAPHETIVVSCSNGFSRTVSAKAARGVAKALTAYNEYRAKDVTCAAAPGAPRPVAAAFVTVECTNGFERRVNAKAVGPIVKALNAYNTRKGTGVTCAPAA